MYIEYFKIRDNSVAKDLAGIIYQAFLVSPPFKSFCSAESDIICFFVVGVPFPRSFFPVQIHPVPHSEKVEELDSTHEAESVAEPDDTTEGANEVHDAKEFFSRVFHDSQLLEVNVDH